MIQKHVDGMGYIKVVTKETKSLKFDILRSNTEHNFSIDVEGEELVIVLLRGIFSAETNSRTYNSPLRRNVFEDKPFALYIQPRSLVEIRLGPDTEVALFRSPIDKEGNVSESFAVYPENINMYSVGIWNYRRTIRQIIGEQSSSTNLIVAETLNPPGNWSGWPPHKHDQEEDPLEVALEEVYYFKIDPLDNGFAVLLNYDYKHPDQLTMLRDSDATVINEGYHTIVAAPGCLVYYLWALAGPKKVLRARQDPKFAWQIREHTLLQEVLRYANH